MVSHTKNIAYTFMIKFRIKYTYITVLSNVIKLVIVGLIGSFFKFIIIILEPYSS